MLCILAFYVIIFLVNININTHMSQFVPQEMPKSNKYPSTRELDVSREVDKALVAKLGERSKTLKAQTIEHLNEEELERQNMERELHKKLEIDSSLDSLDMNSALKVHNYKNQKKISE